MKFWIVLLLGAVGCRGNWQRRSSTSLVFRDDESAPDGSGRINKPMTRNFKFPNEQGRSPRYLRWQTDDSLDHSQNNDYESSFPSDQPSNTQEGLPNSYNHLDHMHFHSQHSGHFPEEEQRVPFNGFPSNSPFPSPPFHGYTPAPKPGFPPSNFPSLNHQGFSQNFPLRYADKIASLQFQQNQFQQHPFQPIPMNQAHSSYTYRPHNLADDRAKPVFRPPRPVDQDSFPSHIQPAASFQQNRKEFSIPNVLDELIQYDDHKCLPKLLCRMTGAPQRRRNLPSFFSSSPVSRAVRMIPDNSPPTMYLRAALLGLSSGDDQCDYEYPRCPKSDDDILYYLNTHRGGFFRHFGDTFSTYPSFSFSSLFDFLPAHLANQQNSIDGGLGGVNPWSYASNFLPTKTSVHTSSHSTYVRPLKSYSFWSKPASYWPSFSGSYWPSSLASYLPSSGSHWPSTSSSLFSPQPGFDWSTAASLFTYPGFSPLVGATTAYRSANSTIKAEGQKKLVGFLADLIKDRLDAKFHEESATEDEEEDMLESRKKRSLPGTHEKNEVEPAKEAQGRIVNRPGLDARYDIPKLPPVYGSPASYGPLNSYGAPISSFSGLFSSGFPSKYGSSFAQDQFPGFYEAESSPTYATAPIQPFSPISPQTSSFPNIFSSFGLQRPQQEGLFSPTPPISPIQPQIPFGLGTFGFLPGSIPNRGVPNQNFPSPSFPSQSILNQNFPTNSNFPSGSLQNRFPQTFPQPQPQSQPQRPFYGYADPNRGAFNSPAPAPAPRPFQSFNNFLRPNEDHKNRVYVTNAHGRNEYYIDTVTGQKHYL